VAAVVITFPLEYWPFLMSQSTTVPPLCSTSDVRGARPAGSVGAADGSGTTIAGNVCYHGTYTESGGRLKLSAVLNTPTGATLVTGDQIPAGTKLQLTADWPADFKDGQHLQITVAGKPVTCRSRRSTISKRGLGA
jgi:hypothetical protein